MGDVACQGVRRYYKALFLPSLHTIFHFIRRSEFSLLKRGVCGVTPNLVTLRRITPPAYFHQVSSFEEHHRWHLFGAMSKNRENDGDGHTEKDIIFHTHRHDELKRGQIISFGLRNYTSLTIRSKQELQARIFLLRTTYYT